MLEIYIPALYSARPGREHFVIHSYYSGTITPFTFGISEFHRIPGGITGTSSPHPHCSLRQNIRVMATTNGHSNESHPKTDPAVYDKYHQAFGEAPLPSKPESWIQRATQVAEIFAKDAAIREKENKSPFAEVSLLKSAGLTKVLGPQKYGGGGQGWDVAYKVIREIAKADGSLGQLIGYHLLWSWTSAVVGTDEQNERTQKLIIENNYFVGGAVNPRDNDQTITDGGDHVVFKGFKHFNTGGVVSDLTVLEGVGRLVLIFPCAIRSLTYHRSMKELTNIFSLLRLPGSQRLYSCTTGTMSAFALPSQVALRSKASKYLGPTRWAGTQKPRHR